MVELPSGGGMVYLDVVLGTLKSVPSAQPSPSPSPLGAHASGSTSGSAVSVGTALMFGLVVLLMAL